MRKFSAIFFLIVFNLYSLGHIAYLCLGPIQITKYWQSEVFDQDDARLREYKIPLKLPPYTQDQTEYQASDGSIALKGKPYRVVFKRCARDTIFFKVIFDGFSNRFSNTITEWIRAVHDNNENQTIPQSEQKSPPMIKEYLVTEILSFGLKVKLWAKLATKHFFTLESVYQLVPTPPPEY